MDQPIYILAGNVAEAKYWMEQQKLSFQNVRYISNELSSRGLKSPNFVMVGTFWDRKDAHDVFISMVMAGGMLLPNSPVPASAIPIQPIVVPPDEPKKTRKPRVKKQPKETPEEPVEQERPKYLFKKIN